MLSRVNDQNILAILGPTNTGKTHFAFERLISYKSGIFGFPLRLLARENYDKARKIITVDKIALITGEEKILPKNAKYFFCTVESMPKDLEVECLVIDEVQLASDYERGHIFTDKILNSRGKYETIFLGSLTIKSILLKLFPKIKINMRDRFSKLYFEKKQNISKLKPRSAIIAFNINKVYEIAETIKSHKGGAAVVLGSLSPRTRNAQVDIYENNKVEYLVATDAIGMGLNLNINHVCFSSLQKFDGKYNRNLFPEEIGQIAGRAGRYKNDGSFGFTKDTGKIDPNIIHLIENHKFNSIKRIYWRNSNIDFLSIPSVLNSLNQFPVKDFFIKKKDSDDELSFRALSNDNDVKQYLDNKVHIKLLWDVCRIPDFQKLIKDNYLELLKRIFINLIINDLKLPEDWLEKKISRLNDYSGGISELSIKIANIRTWTYISNQSNWLENNEYWKEKTRNIEDNLSDHLHENLTNRFVDFSATYFINTKNKGEKPKIIIDENNSIKLNGQIYGYISGFNLKLSNINKSNSLFFLNHVKKTIRLMIDQKINDFINSPDDSINLGSIEKLDMKDDVFIYWGDERIGLLEKGKNIFLPKVKVLKSEFLDSDKKIQVNEKLQNWIDNKIGLLLNPIKNELEESISSNIRSIAFNLFNSLGTMSSEKHQNEIKNLDRKNKIDLSKMGIRIGAKFFFMPNYLKKASMELNAILWRVFNLISDSSPYQLPKDGRVSFIPQVLLPDSYWSAIGYIYIKNFAVRVDVFERIFFLARQKIKFGPFLESSDLMNPIGCNSEQLSNILSFCGFENIELNNGNRIFFLQPKKKKKVEKKSRQNIKKTKKKIIKSKKTIADPNSPFAVLQKLL